MANYRCVTSDGVSGVVTVIGYDENQGGKPYLNSGVWCDFTFSEMPKITQEIKDYLETLPIDERDKLLFKVDNGQIVLRTLTEIQNNQ